MHDYTVPAMRLHQFGVYFYQAILGVRDVQKLVRFEVLSYGEAGRTHGKRPVKAGRAGKVNWDVLENKIAHSADAYQRPVIQRKIAELMDYYLQCAEAQNLPAIPGAVLLVSDRRLDFVPISAHRILGVLQLPPEEGSLRALDGQHRLLALHQLAEEHPAEDVQVPAIIFDRLAPDQVVELFVTINAKHTKLNPSHLISLSGRRLYPDPALAASHDIVRSLSEDSGSPLHGEIKLFGVGHGRVAQAPLAEELKGVFNALDAFGGKQAGRFSRALDALLPELLQAGRQGVPEGLDRQALQHQDRGGAARLPARRSGRLLRDPQVRRRPDRSGAIDNVIEPWGDYIGDARFETDGEWRLKLAGGTRGTVDVLARELRSILRA